MSDDEIEEEEEAFSDVSDEELSDDELAELAEIESAAKTKMAAMDPVLKTSNKIQTIRIVKDDDRVTSNRLTKYEVSRILSIRAQQISDTPIIYAKLSGERDPVKIAYLELSQKKCPLLLRRTINDNNNVLTVEQWNPNEMTIPLINIEV